MGAKKGKGSRLQGPGALAVGLGQQGPSGISCFRRACAELPLPFLCAALTFESPLITRREGETLPAWSETRVVDSAVFRLCHWLPHPVNIHISVHLESKRKAER